MDDISEKISALLNSSEGMERLKSGVMSILGNDNEKASDKPEEQKEEGFSIPENLLNNIGNMQGIMRIANILGNQQQDSRIDLLRALKPHLSKERATRVDRAISLLRIASILPVLREEGLLDYLGF